MRKFFSRIDNSIVSIDAKELMIKAQSFNRIMLRAEGVSMLDSYSLNVLDTRLRTTRLDDVLESMKENGIYLTVEDERIRLLAYTMIEDEMNEKDVAFFFMDCLDKIEAKNNRKKVK